MRIRLNYTKEEKKFVEAVKSGDGEEIALLVPLVGQMALNQALFHATLKNNANIVELLLKNGADYRQTILRGKLEPNVPIQVAFSFGYQKIFDLILQYGGDWAPIGYPQVSSAIIGYSKGNIDNLLLIRRLLERKFDVGGLIEHMEYPFDFVDYVLGEKKWDFALAELFLEFSPQLFINDYRPLFVAANNGNPRILQKILDAGGMQFLKDEGGKIFSPGDGVVGYAVRGGNLDCVRMLVERGAKPTERSLFYALGDEQEEILLYFIGKGFMDDVPLDEWFEINPKELWGRRQKNSAKLGRFRKAVARHIKTHPEDRSLEKWLSFGDSNLLL